MTKSIKVNVCSLSSKVSTRDNPYFHLIAQDLKSGGMYSFILMKDDQTTQSILDSMFKCKVNQSKLFNALLKEMNVATLSSRFIRNPYELVLDIDDSKVPPVFSLTSIREVELKEEKVLKKAFTLNRH